MSQNFALLRKRMKQIPSTPPTSDFPSDVLKWMKKNNVKPKTILKFMQICHFFRHEEFPCCPVINLWGHTRADGLPHWSYQPVGLNIKFYVKEFSKPLWILDSLRLTTFDKLPETIECNIYTLALGQVDMSLNEFKFLVAARKLSKLYLNDSVMRDDNGGILPFEALFEYLPNVNSHKFSNSIFTYSEAARFGESNIHEEPYNIEECFNFFQKNQHIFFNFSIYGSRDEQFIERLQTATDNLIKAWSALNKPPEIYFQDQTPKSKSDLKKLVRLFKKQQK